MHMSRRVEADYDVLVCGGGAAGIGAAIAAAQAGAHVCLVEKYGFLGGAATNSQVLAYCGLFQQGDRPVAAVGGVAREVVAELRTLGLDGEAYRSETTGNWILRLDPEILKFALDRLVIRHGIEVFLHTRVAAATRTGRMIEAVTLAGMDGRRHAVAEAFVDASGDANLAMVAGESYQVGDAEGRLQAVTMPLRIGGVAPDLPIDRARLCAVIAGYNGGGGAYPIHRTDGGIILRLPLSRDMWWLTVDLGMEDLTSGSFTRAEMAGRAMAHEYVALLRREMPGFAHAYLVATGPQVGIRETRHPAARTVLSGADVVAGRQRDDGVARAAWPIELHGAAGRPVYTSVGGVGFAHVPYDAIRAASLDNLWYGGRVIGADPEAYGSVRVMGTAFATGQAAGVAATDYVERVRRVDVAGVRNRLRAQDAII
jgi:hypothetical protein